MRNHALSSATAYFRAPGFRIARTVSSPPASGVLDGFSLPEHDVSALYRTEVPSGGPAKICTTQVYRSKARLEVDGIRSDFRSDSRCEYAGMPNLSELHAPGRDL
jgi:hypothetical protein